MQREEIVALPVEPNQVIAETIASFLGSDGAWGGQPLTIEPIYKRWQKT